MVVGAISMKRESMSYRLRRTIRNDARDEAGFSLIELSIVLIIIGLLATPLIQEYGRYINNKHRDDTAISIRTIDAALAAFQEANGRYVCPSDRSIPFGQPGHGFEDCDKFDDISAGECGGDGGLPGYCIAAGVGAPGDVYIGGVPYATLGIPFKETLDGWSNSITYAVTAAMARSEPATFDPGVSAVRVRSELQLPTEGDLFHGLLVSAGDNGAGAFNIQGQQNPCVMAYAESENCNNDSVFMTSLRTEVQGPNYYDDTIRPRRWDNASIWAYEMGSDSNIYSVNSGNVGIGVPSPTARLDISGNLRTNQLHSNRYCSVDGTDCFDADLIGGDGDECEPGEVAIGIGGNQIRCRSASLDPDISSFPPCATGTFMTGITSTGYICAAP